MACVIAHPVAVIALIRLGGGGGQQNGTVGSRISTGGASHDGGAVSLPHPVMQ